MYIPLKQPLEHGWKSTVRNNFRLSIIFFHRSISPNCLHNCLFMFLFSLFVGGPGGYKRGFSTEEFQTEGQHQQLGFRNNKIDPLYGAALPPKVNPLDTNANALESKDWSTVSRSEFTTEFGPEWKPSMNMTKEETKDYRSKWCSDNPTGRTMRFETEAQRAANAAAPDSLKVVRLRLLPGSPLSLEKLRSIIVENYGILAFSALRAGLPKDEVDDTTFLKVITELGCPVAAKNGGITKLEFAQVMSHMTAGVTFSPTKFFSSIAGSMNAFDVNYVTTTFSKLFGGNIATIGDLLERVNIDVYPELHEGFSQYLSAYATDDVLTCDDFILLHQDMFCSSSGAYDSCIRVLWC
jgi:hypothetical protein